MFQTINRLSALWRSRNQRNRRDQAIHGFMIGIGHRLFPEDMDAILPMSVIEQRRSESFDFNEAYETAMKCPLAVSVPDSFAKIYGVK